jgi:hypothetical protein
LIITDIVADSSESDKNFHDFRQLRSAPIRGLTWSVTVRRGSEFAVPSGSGSPSQDLGLVLDLGIDLMERRCVYPPVMGAEQQFPASGKEDSNVGTSSAAVTAVGRGQTFSCNCSTHG